MSALSMLWVPVVSVVAATTFTGRDAAVVGAVAALVVLGAFGTAAEAALARISPSRAASLVTEQRGGAAVLARLVESPERWRNPLLLAVVTSQLVEAALVGVLAVRWFTPGAAAALIVANVVAMFVLVAAVPRTLAVQRTERVGLLMARPVAALAAFAPWRVLSQILIAVANLIVPGRGLREGPWVSEEELLAMAAVAVESSVIEQDERDLIASIIGFGDTVAREVMVPRPDMITVSADFRAADVMEVAILNGLSRLPATGEGIDDVVGIVFAKDLMRAERDGDHDTPVRSLLRPARYVPETKRIAELLREMQAEQFHMAVVVDEYGGTAGLVTLEDLIEELVGEIVDEYDRAEPMIEPSSDGRLRVNARIGIEELDELTGVTLAEGDWDTVGGLLFHLLGHVPAEGEWAACDGWVLGADRVQGRRILRVVLEPSSCPVAGSGLGDSAEMSDPGERWTS